MLDLYIILTEEKINEICVRESVFQLKDYTVTLENTSDNNTDQTQQKSEKVAPSVTITNREAEIKSEYDRSLYEVLYPKMVRYAQEIEKNALEDLLR